MAKVEGIIGLHEQFEFNDSGHDSWLCHLVLYHLSGSQHHFDIKHFGEQGPEIERKVIIVV